MRASRTDKRVSAIMNVISCKLHKYEDRSFDDIKKMLNVDLPSDIKVFKVLEVSGGFDSKDSNNFREYHYILPTFCLEPVILEDRARLTPEINNAENYRGDYKYKITPELMEKVRLTCAGFKGTKNYHNYTRKMAFSDPKSKRHIYEISVDELVEYENFEAIKFKIIGQSFLYNQIRKIIGMIIDLCRCSKDMAFFENSFLSNRFDVPKAPAEGLYLHRVNIYLISLF
jgi:tRNA pseudouridine38-40 synthase